MKTKLSYLLLFITLMCVLFASCTNKEGTQKPDINKATWDLYSDKPLTDLIGDSLELEKEFLETDENDVQTSFELVEGHVETEYDFFKEQSCPENTSPYTLTINIRSKNNESEKETAESITTYIFLEYNGDENSFSVCQTFTENVKTNGFYETISLHQIPKQIAENELIALLENNSVENLPDANVVPDDITVKTITRRYNHKPADIENMSLQEFPNITLMDILSRFDDAYGEIISTTPIENTNKEYTLISFDCFYEYDWLLSKTLDEFVDGTDITQPYTYSAVYKAEDSDGVSLTARLDIFAEVEPRHSVLTIKESIFTITYENEIIFEDLHDKEETLVLLNTLMMYYPEDAVVTPTVEEAEEHSENV